MPLPPLRRKVSRHLLRQQSKKHSQPDHADFLPKRDEADRLFAIAKRAKRNIRGTRWRGDQPRSRITATLPVQAWDLTQHGGHCRLATTDIGPLTLAHEKIFSPREKIVSLRESAETNRFRFSV